MTTFVVLASVDDGNAITSPIKALHKLGYFPIGLYESAKAVLLTAILFIGPLFEGGVAEGKWRDWIRLRGVGVTVKGWIGYRNYVAVSPPSSSTYTMGDDPDYIVIGTHHRRSSLPLRLRPTSSPSPDLEYNHDLPNADCLRTGACSPLLRVPHHAPSYTPSRRHFAYPVTTYLHHPIRRLRYLSVPANRESTECYTRSCILQLAGFPAILGQGDCWRHDAGS